MISHYNSHASKDDSIDKTFLERNNMKAPIGNIVINKEILDSWKEISSYLNRDIKTCSRWEKRLGLPVHRIDSDSSRSKVFAYKSEIDLWLKERTNNHSLEQKPFPVKRGAAVGLSALASLIIILAVLYLTNLIPTSSTPENLSLAVIPFESQNGSEYETYLTEGITNELKTHLTRLGAIKVISAKSSTKDSEIPENTSQTHDDLGADYILKGKIEKNDEKIGIYVQLIKTKSGKDIWGAKFEGQLEDIFRIQDDISEKIHEILRVKTGQDAMSASNYGKTKDYLAFETYLKGNYILSRLNEDDDDPWKLYHQGHYYWGRSTPEANEIAINLFNQAIKIDSNFAQAYIGLAHCYANYVNFSWDFTLKWLDIAENLLNEAQQISPDLPEYYSTLTEIYILKDICFDEKTKKLAYDLAEEGIKKCPNHAQLNSIVGYCHYLKFGETGNKEELEKALDYKEKGFWLNPYSLSNIVFGELLMLDRDFNRAEEICQIIEKHDASLLAKFKLGEIYYYSGALDQSKAVFQQFSNLPLDLKADSLYHLGMIAAQEGEEEEALRIIQELERVSPEGFVIASQLKMASIYIGLGMKELGYEYLSSFFNDSFARKTHFIYLRYIDLDRNFEKVKNEEKFKKIIKGDNHG